MAKINLTKWERSNPGQQFPRGRGGWMFLVQLQDESEEVKTFCGTYSEAKKACCEYGKRVKAREVYLLP